MLKSLICNQFEIACPRPEVALARIRGALSAGSADYYAFQHPDIMATWIKTIGAATDAEARIVTISSASGLLLCAVPLIRTRRQGIETLGFLDGGISDYNAPILFPHFPDIDSKTMRWLLGEIVQAAGGADLVSFEKIPPAVGRRSNPFALLPVETFSMSSHAATLHESTASTTASTDPKAWDDWKSAHLNSGFRRKSGQKMRNLAKHGPVQYAIAADPVEARRVLDSVFKWKAERQLKLDLDVTPQGHVKFYQHAVEDHMASGLVEVASAKLGEHIIAATLGYRLDGRYYYLLTAYEDGELARYSPGQLLTEQLMKWNFERGVAVFDFCLGDEDFKDRYCEITMPLFQYRAGLTMKGRLAVASIAVVDRIRNVRAYVRDRRRNFGRARHAK